MSWTNDPTNDNVLDDGSTGDDQWTRDAGNGDTEEAPEVYTTKTEREVAFKLIAAHALVDAEYYQRLRENPRDAVAELHFLLDDSDYQYLAGLPSVDGAPGVEWETVDEHIKTVRSALNAKTVVRSLW